MSTSYEAIYEAYEAISQDEDLKHLSTNYYYYVLSLWLDFAISDFVGKCLKDLDDRVEFDQTIDRFIGDDNTTIYNVTNPQGYSLISVVVDGNELPPSQYAYDSGVGTVTFNTAPAQDSKIGIFTYVIGEFNIELNKEEINILAFGVHYHSMYKRVNDSKALNQIIGPQGATLFSQAAHNRTTADIVETQRKVYHKKINEYSYKQTNTEDLYAGLVVKNT